MLELVGAMAALGLSAAASSSGLLTTIRILLPEMHRGLPWWFGGGALAGFFTGVIVAASAFRIVSFTVEGGAAAVRSSPVLLALGVGLLVCSVILVRVRAVASPTVLKVLHRYGRVRIAKEWIPRRLFFQGSRLVFRPRGLLITLTAGLLLSDHLEHPAQSLVGALVYGVVSVAAIVVVVAVFQRSPETHRARFERMQRWVSANASVVAAVAALTTGIMLILRSFDG